MLPFIRRHANFGTLAYALALCGVAVVFAWHPWVERTPYIVNGVISYKNSVAHWQQRIHEVGAEVSERELLRVGSTLTINQAHVLAHAFGEALFEEEGIPAVIYCPNKFAYGCTHQFVGLAVSQSGVGVLVDINELCMKSLGEGTTGCAHAIGHGLIGYFGYSRDGVEKSMRLCDTIEPAGPYSKCLNGVFLEYNFREMGLSDTEPARTRPFTHEIRYTPCDSLSGGYAEACYRDLPLWWGTAPGLQEFSERYMDSGRYCREARKVGAKVSEACFMGIGLIAATDADLDPTRAEELCEIASDTSRERMLCLVNAVFRMNVSGRRDAPRLCTTLGFTPEEERYCYENTSL